MSDMPWLLALRRGAGPTTFLSSLSMRPWKPGSRREGGSLTVASGATAAFTIRRDRKLTLTARIRETEWPVFEAEVGYGMEHPGALSVSLNGAAGPWYPVFVDSPKHGDDWEPSRDGQAPHVFEASVVVRRVDGLAWPALAYFGS